MTDPNSKAESIFLETLEAVKPERIIPGCLSIDAENDLLIAGEHAIPLSEDKPVYLVGTGKASSTMAESAANILGNRLHSGMVITSSKDGADIPQVTILEGSHPLPDNKSLEASKQLLQFIQSIPDDAIVINLVSGGTSSLFEIPAEDISMDDLNATYNLLISSGADIHEINSFRKVISGVKGGKLLQYLSHTTLVDLVISDIPDNDLRMVGSGPTIAQEISAQSAFEIAKQYQIYKELPHAVRARLAKQMDLEKKSGAPVKTEDFEKHHTILAASARQMAEKAVHAAEDAGYRAVLHDEPWSGPIDQLQKLIIDKIDQASSSENSALIFFGECTVQVTGSGKGGRNQELALRIAFELDKRNQNNRMITFLSAGTDGIDGPTDTAGAVVDTTTIREAEKKGIDAAQYLEKNDSYHFFEKAGGHIKTGPSGNNLMDLQVVLISD